MRFLSLQAQERKEALRKIPEQFILSEVRRMVEEMQNLNKKIDEIVSNEILDTFILFTELLFSLDYFCEFSITMLMSLSIS